MFPIVLEYNGKSNTWSYTTNHKVFTNRLEAINEATGGKNVSEVTEFWRALDTASFHYADDSCKEWGEGNKAKNIAIEIRKVLPAEFTVVLDSIAKTQLAKA
jgi:hypothetical protein